MSDIVEKTLAELLKKPIETVNFSSDPNLSKLKRAAHTLYNISLSKIPKLRPEENVARCHIAGLIALEKLESKHPELKIQYYVDRVPLDPRNVLKLKNMFKDILLSSSPVKQQFETNGIKWLSPTKTQVTYANDSNSNIMQMSPTKLSKHLFPNSSPRKGTNSPVITPSRNVTDNFATMIAEDDGCASSEATPSPLKPRARRRLAFELDHLSSSPTKNNESSPSNSSPTRSLRNRKAIDYNQNKRTHGYEPDTPIDDDAQSKDAHSPIKRRRKRNTKSQETENIDEELLQEDDGNVSDTTSLGELDDLNTGESSSPRKKGRPFGAKTKNWKSKPLTPAKAGLDESYSSSSTPLHVTNFQPGITGYFQLKYKKIHPTKIMDVCNSFEIPQNRAMEIMDFYYSNTHYLTSTYRLLCGLILNCCKYIFIKEREENPLLDYILINRMKNVMQCNDENEIFTSMEIVHELLDGDPWFRKLKGDYVNNSREDFLSKLLTRRGSMLQVNQSFGSSNSSGLTVSTEQFESWRDKIAVDLHFKNGK